ncbi:MAG: PLP-dependent aminotransferase family protein, partial [Campylobacterales bacterium]|nr:PLP-dependent aminotransferase family protein [Campylobacterales bacterium]
MYENLTNYYKNANGSIIREILKVSKRDDVISFAGGLPDPTLFPVKKISKILEKISKELNSTNLQYGQTEGEEDLKKLIDKEPILITDGSQQGLDLIGKIFLNPKDRVLVEEPSFLGAIQTFRSYGGKIETVALENDGIDLEALEKKLRKCSYKFLYINPDFQNPTGVCYSLEKRKKLAKISKKYNLTIIEDTPYKSLNFTKKEYPTIYSLAPKQTLFLGSFSKVLAPAFRIGWIKGDPKILKKLAIAKQTANLHTNTLNQRVVCEYLKSKDLESHIKKIKRSYKAKGEYLAKRLEKDFGDEIVFDKPKGGMF